MGWTSRKRLLCALNNDKPDRLPVTTHHVMPYFLENYMGGKSRKEFFGYFGLDQIVWTVPHKPDKNKNEYYDPNHKEIGFLESRRIFSKEWKVETKKIANTKHNTVRYNFITPSGNLSMILKSNDHTTWVSEYLIKEKKDIEILAKHMVHPKCNIEKVNKVADELGDGGIVRGHIPTFDVFGQPGTWQDAACLMNIEELIMATFEDPEWVHEFLQILLERKLTYVESLKSAKYDILELGGGSGSTTIISPRIFDEFVAPYDKQIIQSAHESGQKISYHICGGKMPILENIANMNPDAMETFTPPEMGGDVDLKKASEIIGDRVCMIGGFDQGTYFERSSPEQTRQEVRRCFEAAGKDGGYILAPSDHFFDAKPELVKAFADEAHKCKY